MNPRRVIAAAAAIASVLVVQATLVNPLTLPLAVSLPAIMVATIGLSGGASAGMSIGFSTGLVADLGSTHPVGVLAFGWLVLGLGCGVISDPGRRARVAVPIIALAAGLVSVLTAAGLSAVDANGADLASAFRVALPSMLVDAGLAAFVIFPIRALLRTEGLRAPYAPRTPGPRPVTRPIALGYPQAANDG